MEKKSRAILYQKNGHYYVRINYYIGDVRKSKNYPTGIAVEETNTARGKKNEKAAMKMMAELHQNFVVPGCKTKNTEQYLVDTIKDWLEQRRGSKSASTNAGDQYAANDVMLYFGEIFPVKTVHLTSAMVERYIAWERQRRRPEYAGAYKKKSKYSDLSGIENTIKHRTTLLRSVLNYAKREGIVDRNVASIRDSHVDLPSPQRHEFEVLSVEEAKQLIQMLEKEDLWFKVAVALALLLGLRRSEIIGLRINDIDLEKGILKVTHTITQQTVDGKNTIVPKPFTKNRHAKLFSLTEPLTGLLKEIIDEHHKNEKLFGTSYDMVWNDYLIRYPDGKLVSPNALTNSFAKYVKRIGFKNIRLHDLRHSCASILFANGADLLTIQEVLGHQQLTTTISYTHKISEKKGMVLEEMSKQLWQETVHEEGE